MPPRAVPPISLQLDGITTLGSMPLRGVVSGDAFRALLQPPPVQATGLLVEAVPQLEKWLDPAVGWGLVLPAASAAKPAAIPPALKRLLEARRGRVLYALDDATRFSDLTPEGEKSVEVSSASTGVGPGKIPQYLLLYGTPAEIPWRLQYALAGSRFVGRLWFDGPGLDRYVDAAINGFRAMTKPYTPVVWSVNHAGDITETMSTEIGARFDTAFTQDPDFHSLRLDGAAATAAQLQAALRTQKPPLVITTSHGYAATGDPVLLRQQLGLPIDQANQLLDADALLADWQPDGAIWYAHACCSAGCDESSFLADIFPAGSDIRLFLDGIGQAGACVSPLPERLLTAERPARAFIGHVEPTFDYTIRHPRTGSSRTNLLIEALHARLFQPFPIGYAFDRWLHQALGLFLAHTGQVSSYHSGNNNLDMLLYYRLAAQDVMSTVILGDPAVLFSA
jgi:hypothetical protein